MAFYAFFHYVLSPALQDQYYSLYFIDEKTEAKTSPRSLRHKREFWDSNPGLFPEMAIFLLFAILASAAFLECLPSP